VSSLDTTVEDLRQVVRDLRSELAALRGSSPHALVDGRTLMGPADVARMLGVSTRTLRRLRKSRRFPRPVKGTGRRPRWTRASVVRFMEGS